MLYTWFVSFYEASFLSSTPHDMLYCKEGKRDFKIFVQLKQGRNKMALDTEALNTYSGPWDGKEGGEFLDKSIMFVFDTNGMDGKD